MDECPKGNVINCFMGRDKRMVYFVEVFDDLYVNLTSFYRLIVDNDGEQDSICANLI